MKVHAPALGGEVLVDDMGEVADVEGIAVDEITRELSDMGLDGRISVRLRVALAPADYPGVGLNLDEHQVLADAGMDGEDLNVSDFHRVRPFPQRGWRNVGSVP